MPLVGSHSPKGISRLLLRLPLSLYRLRLGWVLGNRFLMLSHTGRKTGKTRRTVLEVVGYEDSSDTYTAASAWGEKAQWFRNTQHNPQVRIEIGRRNFAAIAERLSHAQAEKVFLDYAGRNPTAFKFLQKLVTGLPFQNIEDACCKMADLVPAVALRPAANSGVEIR